MPVDQKLKDTALSLEQQGKSPSEILDLISKSNSYTDIADTIGKLRTDKKDDGEIYSLIKTAKTNEFRKVKGYADRLSESLSNRGKAIDKEFNAPWNPNMEGFGGRVLRIAGNVAGAIGDPLVEGATSAYRAIVPDSVQGAISDATTQVANDPQFRPFVSGVSRYAQENPEIVGNIESAVNLATLGQVTSAYKGIADTAKIGASKLLPDSVPLKMYTSAVKPGTNVKKGMESISEEMKYAMNKGMMPSQKGLDIVYEDLAKNKAEKQTALALHPNTTIRTGEDALRNIPQLVDEWAGANGKAKYPSESRKIIEDATIKFWNEHGSTMNLNKADNVKTEIYKNQSLYSKGKPRPAGELEEFDKQLARGLKDSIYEAVMDTHPKLALLGEDSQLMIGLKNTFEAAAQRIGRRDIMGIGVPIKTGVGSVVGKYTGLEGLGTVVGVMAGVLDTPTVKAKLAIALDKAKKKSMLNGVNNLEPKKLGARIAVQNISPEEQ
jgi:hypothetical protein